MIVLLTRTGPVQRALCHGRSWRAAWRAFREKQATGPGGSATNIVAATSGRCVKPKATDTGE
jgi:hypothetical protein